MPVMFVISAPATYVPSVLEVGGEYNLYHAPMIPFTSGSLVHVTLNELLVQLAGSGVNPEGKGVVELVLFAFSKFVNNPYLLKGDRVSTANRCSLGYHLHDSGKCLLPV